MILCIVVLVISLFFFYGSSNALNKEDWFKELKKAMYESGQDVPDDMLREALSKVQITSSITSILSLIGMFLSIFLL